MDLNEAMQHMVALAIEDARDDITTSRADAVTRQYLSPAASPNEERQRQLSTLSGLIPQTAYPELDTRMDAAIRRVSTFLSGAPFQLLPRVVIHVGPGLAPVPETRDDCQQYYDKLKNQTEKVVGTCARYYASPVVPLNTVDDVTVVLQAWHAIVSPSVKVLMVPVANVALARILLRQLALRRYLPEVMLCWYHKKGADSFVRVRPTAA